MTENLYPEFDAAGYPTETTLKIIELWPDNDFKELVDYVLRAWKYADFGWVKYGRQYKIDTAGWSGNEDIVEALQQNKSFWHTCWHSSRRGGHYVFVLPKE